MDTAIDLADDNLNIHHITGVNGVNSCSPIEITASAPKGHSTHSTIEGAAPKESSRPSSPVLEDPRLAIIREHLRFEDLNKKHVALLAEHHASISSENKKIEADKQEALEQEAKAAASRKTWSTLATVAQYIAGAGAIVLGAACGGVPGGLLVTAGVVGLTSRAIQDTGILQAAVEWYTKSEELQKKITQNIEMGMFFLQLGLGLAGGIGAWRSGAMAAAKLGSMTTLKSKAALTLTGASQLMTAAGRFGTAIYDKKSAFLMAQMRDLETKMNLNNQTLSSETKELSKLIEMAKSQTDATRKAAHIDVGG